MKTIKDAVHDHIRVDEFALELLDTPEMQRLRHVRQLGTAYLVYPSANHTRFEHSLGVYHLAEKALENLGIGGDERDRVKAAALLHDVGHPPFSHNVEEVIEDKTGKRHDDVMDVFEGKIAQILDDWGVDVDDVAGLVKGEGKLGQLVSGELDVDRMDYLVRDAHHTGVPYGTIDNNRLVLELDFVEDELVLGEGNVQTAEALLIARALMHPTVYNHHVARISKTMLKRATRRLIESGVHAETVRRMDDHDLMVALRESDETRDIGMRLSERRLYKRALWEPTDSFDYDMSGINELEVEREVADKAGVPAGEVIVDVSKPPDMVEFGVQVVVDGERLGLVEASSLVENLQDVQNEQWRVGVYCPEEHKGNVESIARRVI